MKIVTHNGRFHQDDVLASVMLKKIYPHSEIIRTRDQDIINSASIVYDVGGVFDPATLRFDHHQISFDEKFSDKFIYKLSSAGLVFRHFASELIATYGFDTTQDNFKSLVEEIYANYFLGVDAIDNGYNTDSKYMVRGLSNLVSDFNNEESQNESIQYARFGECMKLIEIDLNNIMNKMLFSVFPMQKAVRELLKETEGEILITKEFISPSSVTLYENEYGKDIKFIVHVIKDNDIRVRTVPLGVNTFDSKYYLKKEWRGRRGEELEILSGIPGITFVHATGFIGGCQSLEGALEMCKLSLKD